jgi:hypothetical protein
LSTLNEDSEVLDVLAIASKLEAATLTFPPRASFGHGILLSFGAFDLDGLYVIGVVGIPILSGFVAPTEKLLNIFSGCPFGHFNLSAARACVYLSRYGGYPHNRGPRNDVPIIRRSLGSHTRQPIAQRFLPEKPQY